jgi:hypothetical protein
MELIDLFSIKNDIKIILQILIYKKLLKLVWNWIKRYIYLFKK